MGVKQERGGKRGETFEPQHGAHPAGGKPGLDVRVGVSAAEIAERMSSSGPPSRLHAGMPPSIDPHRGQRNCILSSV